MEVAEMPIPGPMELVLVLVLVLIIFGPGKVPEVGKAVGKGIREFRRASTELEEALTAEPASSSKETKGAAESPSTK